MLRAFAAVTVFVVLLLSIPIASAGAHGRGGFGGSRGFTGGFQGFNPRGGFQGFNPGHAARKMPPRFSKHGRFFPHQRAFVTGGYVIGAYGAPLYYDSTLGDSLVYDRAAYAPAPVYTTPPVYVPFVSHAVPAAPARPSVIEFPEGRYELRGDGMAIPYNWVWIPNPPVAPPAATSPTAPGSGERSPSRRSQLYRWVDEQGVMHLTDNADTVPEQFRKQAKR
jgi:Domain of unknown function (DUF4124)